jgi:hypothetical protein
MGPHELSMGGYGGATRLARGLLAQTGSDAPESSAMGRPGSLGAASIAAEGGTTQPTRLAACLDRA